MSQLGIGDGNVGLKSGELCAQRSGDRARVGIHRRHSLDPNRCAAGGRAPSAGSSSAVAFDADGMYAQSPAMLSTTRDCSAGIEDGVRPSGMEQYPVAAENELRWHHHRHSPADACGDQMAERVVLDKRSPLFSADAAADRGDVHQARGTPS